MSFKEKEKNQKKKNILYVSKYFIKYIDNNIYIYINIYTYKNNERNFSNFFYLASVTTSWHIQCMAIIMEIVNPNEWQKLKLLCF